MVISAKVVRMVGKSLTKPLSANGADQRIC